MVPSHATAANAAENMFSRHPYNDSTPHPRHRIHVDFEVKSSVFAELERHSEIRTPCTTHLLT